MRSRVVVALVAGAALVTGAKVGVVLGIESYVDHREQVSALRLESAMTTFRPEPHPGLSKPLAAGAFGDDRNPRADPASCAPLTVLSSEGAVDGRSWTGAPDSGSIPVTLLTVRFADAGAARAELDRKRLAMLRCHEVAVTFPPFDKPATTYAVGGRHWRSSAVGRTVTWSLDGGGRHFDFFVVRYGNTLTWTYDDDAGTSTARAREVVADDLVGELRDLAGR